jgi:hypothetical protein
MRYLIEIDAETLAGVSWEQAAVIAAETADRLAVLPLLANVEYRLREQRDTQTIPILPVSHTPQGEHDAIRRQDASAALADAQGRETRPEEGVCA